MEVNCRNCPRGTRERCIQQSTTSPSIKLMMRRAFEAETDTQQMWGLLQMNCLLLPKERAVEPPPPPAPTQLSGDESAEAGEAKVVPPSWTPAPARGPIRPPTPAPQPEEAGRARAETLPSRYFLVLQDGRHRISLPTDGEIVLGRFDPTVRENPDVDLSYTDRDSHAISRRHARIVGHGGPLEIEDLGSTNGTMVNGKRLGIGQKVQIRPGDRIALGGRVFLYRPMSMPKTSPYAPPLAYLWVTFNGRRIPLPSQGEVMIGRSDPVAGIVPDIDLSQDGDVAQVVARRHAKIVAQGGRHYVEDLGSANGVKLHGVRVRIGEIGLLEPGDHLWLGGCVLAYDIEHEPYRTA